jgi:hypothetical protein
MFESLSGRNSLRDLTRLRNRAEMTRNKGAPPAARAILQGVAYSPHFCELDGETTRERRYRGRSHVIVSGHRRRRAPPVKSVGGSSVPRHGVHVSAHLAYQSAFVLSASPHTGWQLVPTGNRGSGKQPRILSPALRSIACWQRLEITHSSIDDHERLESVATLNAIVYQQKGVVSRSMGMGGGSIGTRASPSFPDTSP